MSCLLASIFGGFWEASWGEKASQERPKIDKKSIQKSINFLTLFEIGFLVNFGRFWDPKWSQVGTKIHQKSMPRGSPSWASIFDRFLINFWSQLRCPKTKKSLKNHWFYKVFCKIGLPKLRSIFGPILVPTWLHFGSQNRPKSTKNPISKSIKKTDWFLKRFFLSILAPFWEAKWTQVGTKNVSKIDLNFGRPILQKTL